jgi:uncharacterized protein YxjI
MNPLLAHDQLQVVQRRELMELIGIETRNKYELRTSGGEVVGFAAEQGHGLLAGLARYFLGHWRRFDILFFGLDRAPLFRAEHPFRLFFQRLEVMDGDGRAIGAIQQRFALFSKKFDVEDANGRVILQMSSGLFRPWTFPFLRDGAEVARIEKKWTGLFSEALTDADTFRVQFGTTNPDERALLLAAAVFTDLQYFEQKAGQ